MRIACLLLAVLSAPAWSQNLEFCGDFDEGARDYRRMTSVERAHIEGAHFTRDVERLRRGKTGALGNDIDYTLRHMPNNPRALMSIMKLGEKLKTERVPGAQYPVGCYFQRAVRFAPDDGQTHFSFGLYLMSKQNKQAAREHFDESARLAGEAPNLNYNLGLMFLELGDVDAARRHAEIAYAGGNQPPGLANKLRKLGAWDR